MPRVDDSLVEEYYQQHPGTSDVMVYAWTTLANRTDYAHELSFMMEDWLKSDRSTPPPDLVEWVSWYGYIRLRLDDWELPIELTPEEMEQWRAAGYLVDLSDFQKAVASVFGGFADVCRHEPQLVMSIMQQQLEEKLVELDRLASLPLEHYTPHEMPHIVRQVYTEAGLKGQELENAIQDVLADGGHMFELREFDRPFALRQELESFEWGMEKFRMLVMIEHFPAYGLPNRELFEALQSSASTR